MNGKQKFVLLFNNLAQKIYPWLIELDKICVCERERELKVAKWLLMNLCIISLIPTAALWSVPTLQARK